MSLPSYKEAVDRCDPLGFVAEHLSTSDLLACCLVSRQFNLVFAKYLWDDPLRIIGNSTQPAPLHLERYRLFGTSIQVAKKPIRDLVRTIDYRIQWIPKVYPLSIDLRQRTHSECVNHWKSQQTVYQLLADLPNLCQNAKFLFFDGIEFCRASSDSSGCHPILISFRGCERLFDKLGPDRADFLREVIYLDLSHTSIRDAHGYSEYHPNLLLFQNLRVLKMQGVGLRDADLRKVLGTCTSALQLSSLDIRDNKLTDEVIADMEYHLARCLNLGLPTSDMEAALYFEEPPTYTERSRMEEEQEDTVPDITHPPPDSPETFIKHSEQHRNSADIIPRTGITALYLSGNAFTSDTFLRLFQFSDRLQAFDLDAEFRVTRYSKVVALQGHVVQHLKPSSVPTATHLINAFKSHRLESLRAHHSLVTHSPTLQSSHQDRRNASDFLAQILNDARSLNFNTGAQYFLPDVNPRLKSLTLVGLPATCTPSVMARLVEFLYAAAVQEAAIQLARRTVGGRHGAKVLSGLRALRLELDDRGAGPSVSGDADADEFATQSAGDFSFFEEEKRVESDERIHELVSVRDGLREYRGGTLAAFEAERKRLGGVEAWEVPRGPPHYHWFGKLEVVSRSM